jgi:hypothetical protein
MRSSKAKPLAVVVVFIILIFATIQLVSKFGLLEKPAENIPHVQPLPILVFLNYLEPALLENLPPVAQLDSFVSSLSAENYNLFPNGDLLPGQESSSLKLIFSQKPAQQKLEQIFILITSVNRTVPITSGYLYQDALYLVSKNLPDIIINLNSSPEELLKTLQLIPSLAKIKEGTKVIDLRFDNPIIK